MSSTKQCYECKKYFEVANLTDYLYRLPIDGKRKYFCCYTCYNKVRKRLEKEKESNRHEGRSF